VDGLLLQLPTGQITNHYKEDWDLFKIPNWKLVEFDVILLMIY
jgi:hypothetical protein